MAAATRRLIRQIERADEDHEVASVLEDLRAEPALANDVFDVLVRHRDPVLRAWVAWAAPQVLKRNAAPLLLRLAHDRDSDVRDIAVADLVELDPAALAPLVAKLIRDLKSTSFWTPVTAMWALGRLRAGEAREEIAAIRSSSDRAIYRNTAEVVGLLLDRRDDEILRRLHNHDHELMPWLCKGARLIGNDAALEALARAAENAADESCRREAKLALDKARVPWKL